MSPEPGRTESARQTRGGVERIVLVDGPSRVEVVPSLGNACVGFRVNGWRVLDEPPDDAALVTQTSRYGIPILYPWPNRVADGRFRFRGRQIAVPTPKPPHANHGFVRDLAWSLVDHGTDPDGAWVRSRVAVTWPAFPSTLEVVHRLRGTVLRIEATATCTGSEPIPTGFGLHPYFAVPEANRGACTVQVPASSGWELDRYLPTGRVVPRTELRSPRPLGTDAWDDVFTGLDQPFAATLHDPVTGRSVVVRSDPGFREHVVYAPPDRPVVCLEPYTCPTDAFNLEARGLPAGVVVLGPGERWSGTVEIEAHTAV